MNIDAINFTLPQLKAIGISAFDELNEVTSITPPDTLIFSKSTIDDKVLLQDPISKNGILMNKFVLNDIFPDGIDIRPFKTKILQGFRSITQTDADTLNTKYATTLTVTDPDVLNVATGFDVDSVKDFLTFCRVFGFYELTLNDVHLSTIEGKLIISVNSTHDYFTGFIEVLV